MIISVDPSHRDPPYQQIRAQVLAAVASGQLPEGTRLPTIRQLAADLDLAAGTVARSYRELEVDGVIETRGRKGTFARQPPLGPTPETQRRRQLDAAARRCVEESRSLGVTPAEIAAAVARALTAPTT